MKKEKGRISLQLSLDKTYLDEGYKEFIFVIHVRYNQLALSRRRGPIYDTFNTEYFNKPFYNILYDYFKQHGICWHTHEYNGNNKDIIRIIDSMKNYRSYTLDNTEKGLVLSKVSGELVNRSIGKSIVRFVKESALDSYTLYDWNDVQLVLITNKFLHMSREFTHRQIDADELVIPFMYKGERLKSTVNADTITEIIQAL